MTAITGNMLSVVEIPTCCGTSSATPSPQPTEETTKFHFSLNVSDFERSVAFYSVLFGVAPAKHHHDYAKFELEQPPLVFSLVPNAPSSGGSLSHFGFPVGSTEDVKAAAERLAAAGLEITCQEGTVCGYARQDKVWVADPDRNFWEIYVVHEDVDPETVRSAFDGVAPPPATPLVALAGTPSAQILYEHRVLMPLPDRIPHADGTVDEIRLEGLFNDKFTDAERAKFLVDALRALKPAGKLSVHGLASDGPLTGIPELPGVASLVQRVPQDFELTREVSQAGFESIRITKLPENPIFRHGGVGMREIKLEARKPADSNASAAERIVIYKGPFPAAVDDGGQTFHRGIRTPVSQQTWDRLAAGVAASQFVFLGDPCETACGCG